MLRKWFLYHHGEGAPNQHDLYRCLGCRSIITHRIIGRGGCACGHAKLSPTNPTFFELLALLVTPWRFA
ncbi:MAG TPA: hypothetical protein VEA38_00980 [Terriglobales bacterium]|nr:hypothetical protein [Terriglobales bacterium]